MGYGGNSEEFMTSSAMREGLMEEEPVKAGWDLTSGVCRTVVPGGAKAHRWESTRKVLDT